MRLITDLAQPDADGQRLGLIVAATIRTDRYEVMQSAPELAGLTSEVFDDLKPMPPNQFREVITRPAARASAGGHRLSFAPVLVNRLLEEAAEGGDALPLLALTLRRLYDRYGDTGEIMLADYEAMGGMRRVVQNVVDEVVAGEPEQRAGQLAELRAAFIPWLATMADNDEPCGCGTQPPANPSARRSPATRAGCGAWRSAPTAPASPPAVPTRRCGCGPLSPTPRRRLGGRGGEPAELLLTVGG